ncbi:hypothetical protein NXY28_22715 [Bacteroides thetaiotaomicron]|nr:hypothetical protein NXY28_22715 [Bacteroides thetaiotaomicron]
MDHNIFLLDISHLTSIDTSFFIKGEIVLSDNIDTSPLGACGTVAAKQLSRSGGNVYRVVFSGGGDAYTDFFEGICLASEYVLRYNHGNDF